MDTSNIAASSSSPVAKLPPTRAFGFTADLSNQIDDVSASQSFVLVSGLRDSGADDVIQALAEKHGSHSAKKNYISNLRKNVIETDLNNGVLIVLHDIEKIDNNSQNILYKFCMGDLNHSNSFIIAHCNDIKFLEYPAKFLPNLLAILSTRHVQVPLLHTRHDALKALVTHYLEAERLPHSFALEVFALLEVLKWPSSKEDLRQLVRSVASGPPAANGIYTAQAVARTLVNSRLGWRDSGRYSTPPPSCIKRFMALVEDVDVVARLLGCTSTTIQMQLKKPRR
ncbi:hypothetical protein ACIU1J_23500 [Azospirillum doebereinerae]|uniref:hypothetical protein n=1 Tax=Azospirillum doebereinerae TaxID=92933 RepID=UPI001EE523D1|nr:hypothetical protein [Azospirillum doebereinerae]MCG5238747.1 hypothetical protein [Azospirillum doebereinerae]